MALGLNQNISDIVLCSYCMRLWDEWNHCLKTTSSDIVVSPPAMDYCFYITNTDLGGDICWIKLQYPMAFIQPVYLITYIRYIAHISLSLIQGCIE